MHCSEFLELYSDYRDGTIADRRVSREVRQHLRECERCMRYDAVICRGVMALRATSDLESSTHIPHDSANRWGEPTPFHSAPARIGAAFLVAAALALLLWPGADTPAVLPDITEAESQPAEPVLDAPPPPPVTVRFVDLNVPAFRDELPASPQREVSFEGWVALPH